MRRFQLTTITEIKYQRGYDFKRALEELEKETGKKIDVLVPVELGGGNTSTCIPAAFTGCAMSGFQMPARDMKKI